MACPAELARFLDEFLGRLCNDTCTVKKRWHKPEGQEVCRYQPMSFDGPIGDPKHRLVVRLPWQVDSHTEFCTCEGYVRAYGRFGLAPL